jgi:hypothetical protein
MPVVCKTYNRRGNTPPAAYARAHDLGLIPLVRPRGAQHAVGHAKLLRRWALDFLVLPLLPVCRCPLPVVLLVPYLPGCSTWGREAGAELAWVRPLRASPSLWGAFLWAHPRLLSHEILPREAQAQARSQEPGARSSAHPEDEQVGISGRHLSGSISNPPSGIFGTF